MVYVVLLKSRGIRQGCAFSGMLYSTALKPMLNRIRVDLDGFKCENFFPPIKLSAYADDIMVSISGQNEIDKLVDIVNSYGIFSSAKVNWAKTAAYLVGQWKEEKMVLPGGMSWSQCGLKYLGIFLGDESTNQKNWENV